MREDLCDMSCVRDELCEMSVREMSCVREDFVR